MIPEPICEVCNGTGEYPQGSTCPACCGDILEALERVKQSAKARRRDYAIRQQMARDEQEVTARVPYAD